MVNPAMIMKMMEIRNKFTGNHPKFAAFFQRVLSQQVQEGDVIEITVTRPGQEPITSNMRVLREDIELLEEVKSMGRQ